MTGCFPALTPSFTMAASAPTAAALRAGKPTVACPFFGDQPFWGNRIARLGVGPPPLDRKNLSAAKLAQAITEMDDARMRQRAVDLGAAIRAEDGVGTAVAFVERRSGHQCA